MKIALLPDDPQTLGIEKIDISGDKLTILWQDGQVETEHNLDVLRLSAYDSESRIKRKLEPILWDAESANAIPILEYEQLINESTTLEMLMAIRDYGLVKISNVPTEPGTIKFVANKIGTIVINNYGELFDVKTSINQEMGSNTGAYLGPHTDENYRHAPPGISLFHCLESTVSGGGESILVDGFNAAKILRETDWQAYQTLTSVPVLFQRLCLPEEDMRTHARMIATDIDGEIIGIRFTDRTLPPQDLPAEQIEPIYRAIKVFWKIINSEKLNYQYLMQPGDLHIFDNQRVLHGRTAFDPSNCSRHLQQCSVNRDEFHSNLRTLAIKLDHPDYNLNLPEGAFS